MALGNLADIIPSFFVGPNGERLTPDQIRQRQLIAASLRQQATDTSPNAGGWASILSKGIMGLSAGLQEGRADRAAQGAADDSRINIANLLGGLTGDTTVPAAGGTTVGGTSASIPAPAAAGEIAAITPTAPPTDLTKNDVYNGFIGTVKEGGLTNPYGLAALAATGQHESAFSPSNANREWNDGTNNAGGILSWNGPRLNALKAANGGTYGTPQQQAKFFLSEDPQLIADLNGAKSLEEAQARINKAWGFKDPGGRESAARLSAAKGFLPTFTTQTANASPAAAAIEAQSPTGVAPVAYAQPAVVPVERAPLQPVAEAAPLRDYSQMPQVAPSADVNAPVNQPDGVQTAPGAATAAVANALTSAVKGGRLGAPQPLSDSSFNDRFSGQQPISPQSIAQAAQPQPVSPPQQSVPPQAVVQNAAFMPEIAGQSGVSAPQDMPTPAAAPQLAASSPAPVDPVAPQQVAQNAPAQRQPLNIPQAQLPVVHPLSPAVVKTLSNPYASPEEQRIAGMLLQRYQGENEAYQKAQLADQANRQAIQQRVGIADQLGIDRNLVLDEDAWKQAVTKSVGDAPTAVVNGVVINTRTGQPIYGTPELPTSVQEYEYYKQGVPADQTPMSYSDFEQTQKRAGASTVTVGGGSGTQIFDTMNKSADLAQGAATGLNAIREARKAVSAGIVSGAGADQRLGLQKIGAFLGVTDPTEITNTETFRAAIAPQISAVLHATAGTANLSDADREFATKAAGGSINLDEKSINRILGIMEKAGTNSIKLHNSKVDKVYPEGKGFDRERALFRIDEPTPEPQDSGPTSGVTQQEWDAMPPEDKRLFQ